MDAISAPGKTPALDESLSCIAQSLCLFQVTLATNTLLYVQNRHQRRSQDAPLLLLASPRLFLDCWSECSSHYAKVVQNRREAQATTTRPTASTATACVSQGEVRPWSWPHLTMYTAGRYTLTCDTLAQKNTHSALPVGEAEYPKLAQ